MRPGTIIPRERAARDIDEAIGYYLGEGAAEAAPGFIDALEQAFVQIARHPESGSHRYARELKLAGLRSWVAPRPGTQEFPLVPRGP